jgi:hypothetical protein
VIFLFCSIVQGYIHAVSAHVPGDVAVLLDVRYVEREIAHAVAEGSAQVISDGITAVDGFVMRRKRPEPNPLLQLSHFLMSIDRDPVISYGLRIASSVLIRTA